VTQEELIAALAPVRLPAAMRVLEGREMLALLGLGLLAAVLIAVLLRPLLTRRASLRSRLKATRGLPADERLLAIARITGRLPSDLRDAAYRSSPPSDAEIERASRMRLRR
jgi:type II secretory pathway component PulM